MSDSKTMMLGVMRAQGLADALDLRERAPQLDGTAIIAEEQKIPSWDGGKDYTGWERGQPVQHEGQVYTLITPHNAAHYPDTTPPVLPALWRVKHTTDPSRAKPYVKPTSTSDMYVTGECCVWTDGIVYRAKRNTNFSPGEYPDDWEEVTTTE